MSYFDDVSEEEIEKFRPLLDRSIDDVKTELQTLANNYYESIIVNDTELFNDTVERLNQYLEFDITDINEYLNYCLVSAGNGILKKICDVNSIYVPKSVDLQFRTKYTRDNENYIKRFGLSEADVELLTQYIKEKHEIYCLTTALGGDLINNLKPQTQLPQDLANVTIINTNYIRNEEIKKSGELFFALEKAFGKRAK